jgi:hypothetical protein
MTRLRLTASTRQAEDREQRTDDREWNGELGMMRIAETNYPRSENQSLC